MTTAIVSSVASEVKTLSEAAKDSASGYLMALGALLLIGVLFWQTTGLEAGARRLSETEAVAFIVAGGAILIFGCCARCLVVLRGMGSTEDVTKKGLEEIREMMDKGLAQIKELAGKTGGI
ncbi:MAG TPA: hypothetical protein VJB57_00280 [Dehalococcoidia bacterium]|nr:hypothetical protein [Dehalococcoidia bacterium]